MNSHFDDIEKISHSAVSSQEICIWVPSNHLVIHHVPVPSAPKRKWPELLPWMLEDKLLQAPEDMHFVIAGKRNNELIVYAVAKKQMQDWKDNVEALGLDNVQFIPDYLALPWHSGLLSIARRDDQILVRYGEHEGFSVKENLAWHMIRDLISNSDSALSLSISLPIDELPENLNDKVETKQPNVDWQNFSFPHNANLLKGEFTLSSSANNLMPWLKTAALFVLALILSFATLNLTNARLENEIANLSEQNRSEFYSLFPGLTIRSGDIRTTLEDFISNQFRQRESMQNELMQLLTSVDSALSACNCDLQNLGWSNGNLELIFPQSSATIIEQLQLNGYTKQINSADEDNISLTLNREYGR